MKNQPKKKPRVVFTFIKRAMNKLQRVKAKAREATLHDSVGVADTRDAEIESLKAELAKRWPREVQDQYEKFESELGIRRFQMEKMEAELASLRTVAREAKETVVEYELNGDVFIHELTKALSDHTAKGYKLE